MDGTDASGLGGDHFRLLDLPRDSINHVFLQIPVHALVACRATAKSIAALRREAIYDTAELLPTVQSLHYLQWLIAYRRIPLTVACRISVWWHSLVTWSCASGR